MIGSEHNERRTMPEVKQVERVIRILQRLALTQQTTVNELFEYFDRGVPKRTLQRDLVELSCADIPLKTRSGHGKELIWYLDSAFLRFVPETIGSNELLASYFLERLASITKGTKLEKDIQSLFKKTKQLVSPEVFQSLEGYDPSQGMFGVTFAGYIDYGPFSETIDILVSATSTCRTCKFTYQATWKATVSEFEADPYLLLYHKGAIYAVVYVTAHKNYIFLPVQRIKKVQPTGQTFKRHKDFSLESLRKNRFGIFGHEGLHPQKVVLKFEKSIANIVAERIWHPTQKITRHRNGTLTLEMKTIISDELRSWVGGWLGYVKVIQPKDLLSTSDRTKV